ncbi:MAG: Iron-regulated protein precursor [Labilithrix sp.]|nr:Iron-regulated protein precursor [Labilithrix sp.]
MRSLPIRFWPALVMGVVLAASASLPVAVPGCSSNTPSAVDAKPALGDLTANVILPTYRSVDSSADALVGAVHTLQQAPSAATLAAAQVAWRGARKAWNNADAFRFGPVITLGISDAVNFAAARGTTIDAYVTGTGPIDQASFDALGSNTKGFHGLEYVLFDSAAGDAAVLARLTTDASAARRLSFTALAAEDLKAKTAKLYAAWDPAAGNFAKELTTAGSGSVLFASGKAAVDQLINSCIASLDAVTGAKLGKPYGTQSGGRPVPDAEESPRSDNSIADMLDTLEGVRNVYLGVYGGVDSKGLQDLVREKDASLDDTFLTTLEAARAKIAAIPAPFRTAFVNEATRPVVGDAYQACRVNKRSLQVDIANAFGTSLQINETDGD